MYSLGFVNRYSVLIVHYWVFPTYIHNEIILKEYSSNKFIQGLSIYIVCPNLRKIQPDIFHMFIWEYNSRSHQIIKVFFNLMSHNFESLYFAGHIKQFVKINEIENCEVEALTGYNLYYRSVQFYWFSCSLRSLGHQTLLIFERILQYSYTFMYSRLCAYSLTGWPFRGSG